MIRQSTLAAAALALLASGGLAVAASSTTGANAKASTSASTASLSADQQKFLTDAIEGDNSEMALGGLALGRGSSLAVRDFGLTLINDHRQAKMGAQTLAHKYGVESPMDLKPEAKAELQKLLGLTGDAFDQEFARYMVEDHTKDVADFKAQAKSKDDIGAYAAKTLPDLEKHLKMAQSIASNAGKSGTTTDTSSSASSSMSSSMSSMSSEEPSSSASSSSAM